jgi:hypothetical protein
VATTVVRPRGARAHDTAAVASPAEEAPRNLLIHNSVRTPYFSSKSHFRETLGWIRRKIYIRKRVDDEQCAIIYSRTAATTSFSAIPRLINILLLDQLRPFSRGGDLTHKKVRQLRHQRTSPSPIRRRELDAPGTRNNLPLASYSARVSVCKSDDGPGGCQQQGIRIGHRFVLVYV